MAVTTDAGASLLWQSGEGDEPSAFTMLTTALGPDVAPIHDRQVAVLPQVDWAAWVYLTKPEIDLVRPLPAGSLRVETKNRW